MTCRPSPRRSGTAPARPARLGSVSRISDTATTSIPSSAERSSIACPRLVSRSPRLEPIPTKALVIPAAMFAVLRRLGVVLVVAALALSVGPASAWASGLSRAQARELRLYDSGLVLARPGAGPALRKAGGAKLANALPIWRVPAARRSVFFAGLIRSNLVSVVAADQPLLPMATPPPAEGTDWWIANRRRERRGFARRGQAADDHRHGRRPDTRGVRESSGDDGAEPAEHHGAPRGARHRRRVGRCRSSEQRRSPRRLSPGQPLRLGREPQRGRNHCRRRHPGARCRDAPRRRRRQPQSGVADQEPAPRHHDRPRPGRRSPRSRCGGKRPPSWAARGSTRQAFRMSSPWARSTPAASRPTSRAGRRTSTSRLPARSSTWRSRRRSTRRPATTSSTERASPRRSSRPPPTGSGRSARTWTGRRSQRCSARRRRTSTPRGSTRSPASGA